MLQNVVFIGVCRTSDLAKEIVFSNELSKKYNVYSLYYESAIEFLVDIKHLPIFDILVFEETAIKHEKQNEINLIFEQLLQYCNKKKK